MSDFCPFFINSNICLKKEDLFDFDMFLKRICWNTGNSYITYSLIKTFFGKMIEINHIPSIYQYDFSKQEKDIEFINANCSHVILVLQDQIRVMLESYGSQLPYIELANFLKKIDKPILVAGLGLNSFEEIDKDWHKRLNPELVSLLHTISEKCKIIGLRGYMSQEILKRLGIENTQAIGCPSYYEAGRNRQIIKKPFSSDLKILLSNPQKYEWMSKYPVILQDEWKLMEAIAFDKNNFNNLSDDELLLVERKHYQTFSNIDEWKNYVSKFDFVMGNRVHGSVLATNCGVPALCFNWDQRAKEMMDFFKIPRFPELTHISDIEQIYDACDYSDMNKSYPEAYDNYICFLEKNGFFIQKETMKNAVALKQPSLILYSSKVDEKLSQEKYRRLLRKISYLEEIIHSEGEALNSKTSNLEKQIEKLLKRPSFFEYQRVRLLSHITFGKMKRHYVEKKKKYKQYLR